MSFWLMTGRSARWSILETRPQYWPIGWVLLFPLLPSFIFNFIIPTITWHYMPNTTQQTIDQQVQIGPQRWDECVIIGLYFSHDHLSKNPTPFLLAEVQILWVAGKVYVANFLMNSFCFSLWSFVCFMLSSSADTPCWSSSMRSGVRCGCKPGGWLDVFLHKLVVSLFHTDQQYEQCEHLPILY